MDPGIELTASPSRSKELVLRNTMLLIVAKILATPISILVSAITARYLGPENYSYIYLASTFVGFGTLLIHFGQNGTLPALVARDRSLSGTYLGSALAWRLMSSVLVYLFLAGGCLLLGYDLEFQHVLALVMVSAIVQAISGACLDVVRGFERTDMDAMTSVGVPILNALIIIPVLLLGGRLKAVLLCDIAVFTIGLLVISRLVRPVGITKLSVDKATVRKLFVDGYPFLFFGLALALQPNIDALFLSKLAPAEVVGWHAASRRLVGLLVFPASALIAALYPVLCRLFVEDKGAYASTAQSALRSSILLVVPAAMGCALFPDIGITIFSKEKFGPAEDNLRVLSAFVLLLYVSMPIGSALLAAGRARSWSLVQTLCVLFSAVLDPLLVPWFQEHAANGGLGICVSNVLSELFMVLIGLWLLPVGVLDRHLWRIVLLSSLSGGAMGLVAWLLSAASSWVAAPFSLAAYVGCMWAFGGLGKEQIQTFRDILARKAKR